MTPEEHQQLLQYTAVIREFAVSMDLMGAAMRRTAASLETWSEAMTTDTESQGARPR